MAGNGFLKKLSISGIITASVRLQSAARTETVSLKGLHAKCWADPKRTAPPFLNQLFRCQVCDETVPQEARLGGYKIGDGYVVITPEEVKDQQATPDAVLTVQALIPEDQIPRIRLDKCYYMGPEDPPKIVKGQPLFTIDHQVFEMFRAQLIEAGRAAIVTYAERGHEKAGVIFGLEVGCLLYEVFFDNEIPAIEEAGFKPGSFTTPPLTTKQAGLGALVLQRLFADEFDWSVLEDGYVARMHTIATAKANGTELVMPTAPTPATSINDFEQALEAALGLEAKPPQPMPAKPKAKAGKKEQAA